MLGLLVAAITVPALWLLWSMVYHRGSAGQRRLFLGVYLILSAAVIVLTYQLDYFALSQTNTIGLVTGAAFFYSLGRLWDYRVKNRRQAPH